MEHAHNNVQQRRNNINEHQQRGCAERWGCFVSLFILLLISAAAENKKKKRGGDQRTKALILDKKKRKRETEANVNLDHRESKPHAHLSSSSFPS